MIVRLLVVVFLAEVGGVAVWLASGAEPNSAANWVLWLGMCGVVLVKFPLPDEPRRHRR